MHSDDSEVLLASVLAERRVRTVFQPLIDLDTGEIRGYEALSRGPARSSLERPDLLFAAARRHGRLVELDRLCRETAVVSAAALGGATYRLFVNGEAEALAVDNDGLAPIVEVATAQGISVVLEITERDLVLDPARLMQVVAYVRERGWGIALDDVGADPTSLALIPLLRPDVIKLDLRLVQDRPDRDIAEVVNAVNAEAERSGASVLAEGIETERHIEVARSFGATLGQGYFYGRPAPLPALLPAPPRKAIPLVSWASQPPGASAFAVAARARPTRIGHKALLIEISKLLESRAGAVGDTAIVLSAFQSVQFFTPLTARRYGDLQERVAFVGALGVGMPTEPVRGVRGAVLDAGDVITGEWDIAVLSPHFAAALVARDLGDDGPDEHRTFEFVLTHDRVLVADIAAALMSRIAPELTPNSAGASPALVGAPA